MITDEVIQGWIADFLTVSPLNRVEEQGIQQIFVEPLVGVAAASDPLFATLKKPGVVNPNHLSPEQWLPGASSVISYFLPFSQEIRLPNHPPGLPGIQWLYGRIEGEALNNALRHHLIGKLTTEGEQAVAPLLTCRFTVNDYVSNWSERHVAFIAGLGTFGLSKSLITSKGCAGRYGSVVTTMVIQPTSRPYEGVYEYCSQCGICIDRCPVDAITDQGKDDKRCDTFVYEEVLARYTPRFGCGKCQTAVPCETQRMGVKGKKI